MKFSNTPLKDLFIVEPKIHGDSRGYFCETFRQDLFDAYVGRHIDFIQDNQSSSTCGVLRGLHFQQGAHAQAKLVRVSQGTVWDVAVDLRRDSPTYGRFFGIELTEENHLQLFIPRGFAHGFKVLSPQAVFQYKVDSPYCPEAEVTLQYNDPAVAIAWPRQHIQPILSEKDTSRALTLSQLEAGNLLF